MPYVEDVDEDVDESDTYEDIEDALGEDELSERRRRRRRKRARGGNYTQPRVSNSAVNQTQLMATASRIGTDVRTLNSDINSVEARLERSRREQAQALQMMTILPLLTKKTATVGAEGTLPANTKVLVDDGDLLTLLLPMMLLGGLGGTSSAYGAAPSGGMDPMMMIVLVIALQGNKSNK